MTAATAVKFEPIKTADLNEAPYNPRRTFEDEALKELVESVKAKGVLTPLLVRPIAKGFEIVGGARRFRAAKQAGLKEVPCQIREFNDDEALEAAVIDNLQRSDVSPLDEARGYQELLKRGHKIEDLAKRIGKSVRYIYARLELGKLAPPVLRALDDGKITASHAQLIATIDSEEGQKKVLEKAFVEAYETSGDEQLVEPKIDGEIKATVSVRDFQRIVTAEKVGIDLVEQLEALKLAGHKAVLISNEGWGQAKQIVTRNRWKSQGSKPCKYPAKGIMADEKGRGKVLDICLTTSCKKHFATHPVSSWNKPKSPEQLERERRAEEAAKAKAELDKRIKLEAYRQICNKVREIPKLALAYLISQSMGYREEEHLEAVLPGISKGTSTARVKKILELKPIQLGQLAIGVLCTGDINGEGWGVRLRLGDFMKDLGINAAALEKGIRGKLANEARDKKLAEQKAKKTPAKKAGKR